jgi:peptidoglycan/LPS O-acetylase OafA/YrhL
MSKNIETHPRALYFSCADGIRGLACVIVLITHAITMFFINSSPYLAGSGKIGCWLFFVLSAFLLTTKFKATGFGSSQLIHYGISRFLRIIPLYLVALIVYKFLGTTGISSWRNVVDALFLKQGFSHLWTIPVEVKFYFYLPLVAFILIQSAKLNPLLTTLFFVIFIAIEQLCWPYWHTPINAIEVNYYLTPFTTGVFFAAIYERLKPYATSKNANLIGFATMIGCLVSLPISKLYFFKTPLDLSLANQFIYFGLIWALFIVFTLEGKGLYGRLLCTSFFRMIGKWSYSIYLFHWLVYVKFIQHWPNSILVMSVALISAILVGGVVFYLVEKPLEGLRQYSKAKPSLKKGVFYLRMRTWGRLSFTIK